MGGLMASFCKVGFEAEAFKFIKQENRVPAFDRNAQWL
jgi:hypothetical protein